MRKMRGKKRRQPASKTAKTQEEHPTTCITRPQTVSPKKIARNSRTKREDKISKREKEEKQ